MRVMVLGHKGMLGNALCRYFSGAGFEVTTTTARYPEEVFFTEIKQGQADFIVNCVGAIPQKGASVIDYQNLNEDLPRELDELGIPVLHPSTDCEFNGQLPKGQKYEKNHERNAEDDYGVSKAVISRWIENESKNTKIIRTSIVGHETDTHYSLLDWFLSQTEDVKGYTDQYWSGITTLTWAEQAATIIRSWDQAPKLTQLASSECVSKHELLQIFKRVYDRSTIIHPVTSGKPVNKCLYSDISLPKIEDQLRQLRTFYGK